MLHFSLNRAVLEVGTSDQVIENEQTASLLGSADTTQQILFYSLSSSKKTLTGAVRYCRWLPLRRPVPTRMGHHNRGR